HASAHSNFLYSNANPDSAFNPDSSDSSSDSDSNAEAQTIQHVVNGETLSFQVPVRTDSASKGPVVMLEPIIDIFPETIALRRPDGSSIPFLVSSEDVLLVPMRVAYCPGETLHVVPGSTPSPVALSELERSSLSIQSRLESSSTSTLASNQESLDIFAGTCTRRTQAQYMARGHDGLSFERYAAELMRNGVHHPSSYNPISLPENPDHSNDEEDLFRFLEMRAILENSNSDSDADGDDNSAGNEDIFNHLNDIRNNDFNSNLETVENYPSAELTALGAALVSQSLPLSEQAVPRLFIILPDLKPRSNWGGVGEPRSSQTFRLYFLCDCGPGATFPADRDSISVGTDENTSTSHPFDRNDGCSDTDTADHIDLRNCIHIANQSGYQVLDLKQFTEQFGLYTLLILRLFQQGLNTTAAKRGRIPQSKIAIPPLSQRHYTDVLAPFTWEIEERVSTAIKALEEMMVSFLSMEGNILSALLSLNIEEGVPLVDIHRLWECVEGLRIGGSYHVEGMRRAFVHDGTIRWICSNHFQSTFNYMHEDRDILLWRCKEILGDDQGDNISKQLSNNQGPNDDPYDDNDDDFRHTAGTEKAVVFDDQTQHLRLSGLTSVKQVNELENVLENGYMIQQVTLVSTFASDNLVMALIDMISTSKISLWALTLAPDLQLQQGVDNNDSTVEYIRAKALKRRSIILPRYSQNADHDPLHFNGTTEAGAIHLPSNGSNSSCNGRNRDSVPQFGSTSSQRQLQGGLQPICNAFVLQQIQTLQIPDLDRGLFTGLDPSPGDFPHLRILELWGSDASGLQRVNSHNIGGGEGNSAMCTVSSINKPWNTQGLGSLIRAFSNLKELHITGIDLGINMIISTVDDANISAALLTRLTRHPAQLLEIAQSLLYLPRLSVLELSSCGLRREHCSTLAASLNLLENRITHLDIHNNPNLDDEGLAELIWAIGRKLYLLDARHTGFGNTSAFALASMLQAHQTEIQQNNETHGWSSSMAIYKVLRLEETQRVPNHTKDPALDNTASSSPPKQDLDATGRHNLVQALELLESKELCLRFDLGFVDEDFASALTGMKNLECLERLQLAGSNFGPLALEAMLRTFRATSCRLQELELHDTLLSEEQQRDARDELLNF
ncbi:hypothetical protein BX616_004740, partial [Lobosporangium transversale]